MAQDEAVDRSSPSGEHPKTNQRALWLCVALFALPFAIYSLLPKDIFDTSDPSAEATPLAEFSFDDGVHMKILRAELTRELRYESRPATSFFRPVITRSYSSKFNQAGMVIGKEVQNDTHLKKATLSMEPDAPTLMLLTSVRTASERILAPDTFFASGRLYDIRRKNGVFDSATASTTPSNSINDAPLAFEADDGGGGWLPFSGPIIMGDRDGRGFAALKVFPRRKLELKLRAIRAGVAPVEFTIPNPGYSTNVEEKTAVQTLPVTLQKGEYKVTLESVTRNARGGVNFNTWANPRKERRILYTGTTEVRDMTGNFLPYGIEAQGYVPLPGEDTLRVTYRAQRNPSQYPWKAAEVLMIGEARLSSDGTTIEASKITPDGSSAGLSMFSCTVISPKPGSSERPKLEIRMGGVFDRAQFSSFASGYDHQHVAVFWDGETSEGVAVCGGTEQTQLTSGRSSLQSRHEWEGTLHPGKKFRVAIMPRQTPTEFEFVVRVPPKNSSGP